VICTNAYFEESPGSVQWCHRSSLLAFESWRHYAGNRQWAGNGMRAKFPVTINPGKYVEFLPASKKILSTSHFSKDPTIRSS